MSVVSLPFAAETLVGHGCRGMLPVPRSLAVDVLNVISQVDSGSVRLWACHQPSSRLMEAALGFGLGLFGGLPPNPAGPAAGFVPGPYPAKWLMLTVEN